MRGLKAAAACTLLLVTASLATASGAWASIVVGQGIAGLKLGDTEAQVAGALGAPTLQQTPNSQGEVEWNYAKLPLAGAVGFANGELVGMWTSSKAQKTSKGVGVGSSLSKVKQAYPGIKCSTGPFGPKSVVCTLRSTYKGRRVETVFPFFTRSMGAREVDIDFG